MCIRDSVSPGKDGICLEGTLYISALVQSRTGAMSQLSQAIPFTPVSYTHLMRFRPGKRAGTAPLRRASGRQNLQGKKTYGFHPF